MYIVKNPAKSRPLSANVRRLMKMARESPLNPNVEKIEVVRRGKVRRAKLNYLRGRVGKAAKVKAAAVK